MNIKQAKEQIQYAVSAYLSRNAFGEPEIPVERQRPIFLMGAPGIGKTAIMEQIAQELGIGIVSYSMTHHTRQSALGLPFIVHKTYRGQEYDISEYTMSEIIASVYDCIEDNGVETGILFLDEINCVSETLAPSMLQFLQYKTFGRHRVPDGWVVVTAGNPPEYNNSVREFDIVTWDRLKRIDIEPDFKVWKEYAASHGVHPSVLSYLEIHKEDFYRVEAIAGGKSFVTARGWVDLSDMMRIYEKKGYPVNEQLIGQYLQNTSVAQSFSVYYRLFKKYQSDYQLENILAGKASALIKQRATKAKFDERLSLLSLLLDALENGFKKIALAESILTVLMNDLRAMKATFAESNAEMSAGILTKRSGQLVKDTQNKRKANSISKETAYANCCAADVLAKMSAAILEEGVEDGSQAFGIVKHIFDEENAKLKKGVAELRNQMENMFAFCEEVFSDGHELLILVTELTHRPDAARFIGKYGCDAYFRNNKKLLFYERKNEILRSIEELNLEE